MKKKVTIEDGNTKDHFSEDEVDHSWYARDFLEFITGLLWDVYPRLRPIIKKAKEACWKVWHQEAQEYYKTSDTINVIIKPIGMIKSQRSYRSVIRFYLRSLDQRLDQLIKGLWDGTFHEINDDKDTSR